MKFLLAIILKLYFHEGRWYARICIIQRNKWIEGPQSHFPGKMIIFKLYFCQWELSIKNALFKMRKPRHTCVLQARSWSAVPLVHIAIKHAGIQKLPLSLRFHGYVAEPIVRFLVGTIENLPVDQSSVACKPDAATSDTP